MPKFTVRVEILNSRVADYKLLHLKMEEAGFSRTIKDKDGKVYLLPHAEYNFSGDEKKKKKILELVKKVVTAIDKKCSILVTLSAGRIWCDLEEVKELEETK